MGRGHYGLSEAEEQIMEMIWEQNREIGFSQVMDYLVNEKGSTWKKQTVKTYLDHLVKKKALSSRKEGNKCIYYPSMSKQHYISYWTKKIMDDVCHGSLKNLILAFTGGEKITPKETEEILELLKK